MTARPAPGLELDAAFPPDHFSAALKALWWDHKGAWGKAHDAVAVGVGRDAAWVHAYLHRKEGDIGNAAYWYDRAGRPQATGLLQEEWASIIDALLR